MLTTADKFTLKQEQARVGSTLSLSTCLGEILRQALLFPVLHIFVSTSANTKELTGRGPYVFAANHSSHLDTPVLLAVLPLRLRMQICIAAAADYFFAQRWKGVLVSLFLNAFPFERKQPGCNASLAYAQRLLQQGHSLLIFPEGTRTRDGQIQHFKHGVGRIVCNSGACVVPTWIDGTYRALPKGARWPRHQTVTVKFGAPLHFSHSDDPSYIAAEVERAVRALAIPAQGPLARVRGTAPEAEQQTR
jgi:1-acyl-sn-glycerol-3-phosphate acyltransferase